LGDILAIEETEWLAVIGRALAQLCLDAGPAKDKSISDKAHFLEALGLDHEDVAEMLDSTPASVRELLRQRKGAKKRGKKKRK
jgi:hypothetical protein